MDDAFRQAVIDRLQQGEALPSDWARELFPPERREYELVYHAKEREEDVVGGTMAVPLQPVSEFGSGSEDDGWRNMLIFGDNLQVTKTLLKMKQEGRLLSADGTAGIKLAYIDPPFATKREFRGKRDQDAYRDKIDGAQFVEFVRKRLILLREVMAEDATIYVHLDSKKAHYIKVILDELFGEAAFRSEIIWKRTNARAAKGLWPRVHDTILVYNKGGGSGFSPLQTKADEAKLPHTLITGPDGLKYQTYELTGDGTTQQGESGKPWRNISPPPGRHWGQTHSSMDGLDQAGLIHWPSKGGFPRRRSQEPFDPNERKVHVGDVWTDIDRINQSAKERNGYPTQKPEALLARIVEASTEAGDLVLDVFAGSGTTAAVAEKLRRRWIAVDCGKLAIYTIQRRLLDLKSAIGNAGRSKCPVRPFTVFNAGLYDFSSLAKLPRADWRFFALQLFGCRDEAHVVNGLELDGKLRGGSVLVFDHIAHAGKRIDEHTIKDIHLAVGKRVSDKFYIIAPRGVFDFQQDYLDLDGVRYYALRIPYSIISELHRRDFSALRQPSDEWAVNETVDAVGFDFVQPPAVSWRVGKARSEGELLEHAYLAVDAFESRARLRGKETTTGLESLSMVLLDFDYDGEVFKFDRAVFAHELEENGWQVHFPVSRLGAQLMAVFTDVFGNEARELITREKFEGATIAGRAEVA